MRNRLRASTVSLMPAQKRPQNFFQRAAPAKDAGLHRANIAFQNFRDFLVTEAFQVAQNHRAAKGLGNLLQSAMDRRLNFQSSELLERRGAELLDFTARLSFSPFGLHENILLHLALS